MIFLLQKLDLVLKIDLVRDTNESDNMEWRDKYGGLNNLKILGCGSSLGVPVVGCACSVCASCSKVNRRYRCAIYIQSMSNQSILVDFGPDIRSQLLAHGIVRIDAVILTHPHADHISGINDIRPILASRPTPLYLSEESAQQLHKCYKYIIDAELFDLRIVAHGDCLTFQQLGMNLVFFEQPHGFISSLGLRIGDLVYANDMSGILPKSAQYFKNLDVLIIDCKDLHSNHAHIGLDQVLQIVHKYSPKTTYLTNMSHNIDYLAIQDHLPKFIRPAYDGLVISLRKN